MTCAECIARSSDFLDELLGADERARHQRHIERCASCARYHRVLEGGLRLVREMPHVQPSGDFTVRLNRGLRCVDEERTLHHQTVLAGASVTIALASLIALAAWTPILRNADPAGSVDAAVAANAPPAEESAGSAGSAVAAEAWQYPNGLSPYVRPTVSPPPSLTAAFPGPYSPLFIEPPGTGRWSTARTVLATYLNNVE